MKTRPPHFPLSGKGAMHLRPAAPSCEPEAAKTDGPTAALTDQLQQEGEFI